jgi:hypothetical protein
MAASVYVRVLGALLAAFTLLAGSPPLTPGVRAGGDPAMGTQEPSQQDVLARASTYAADFQKQLAGIVLEETYEQDVRGIPGMQMRTGSMRRTLRSDVLLVKVEGVDRWVQFRDVFEVDGKPLRDRDARLEQLFLKPSRSSFAQAERIALESARHNLGNVQRTINLPVLALIFLDPAQLPRFTFTRVRPGNIRPFAGIIAADDDVWALQFQEDKTNTVIRTTANRDLPAHGRFWIDAPTGRVLRTEIISEDVSIRGKVDVTYRLEPGLGFLVPGEMREEYINRGRNTRILGEARYGKFKKFSVTTEETIKKPGQ